MLIQRLTWEPYNPLYLKSPKTQNNNNNKKKIKNPPITHHQHIIFNQLSF